MASHFGEMATENVCAASDGFVGLVDCVAAEHDGVSADSCLRVDDCVAADDRGAAIDTAGYVQVSKENEGAAGQVAFDLHGAEDADGVVHLLSGGDEDVLPEVDAVTACLGVRCGYKQNRKAENPSCTGQQGSPNGKDACPMVVRRMGDFGSALYLETAAKGRVRWGRPETDTGDGE
jgi:hypothetical protein